MKQVTKFWLAMAIIVIVCYYDWYLFGEGYGVRRVSGTLRQAGHFATLLSVMAAGYWAWKKHPMQWLKSLWMYTYVIGTAFILLVGAIKIATNILSNDFLEWVTTIRYLLTSPLPHVLMYMLTLIASQKNN